MWDGLAILIGAVIGLIVGITGVGGGVLIFPAMTAVFSLSSVEAVATAFVFAFVSRIGAAISHYSLGNIVMKLGFLVGVGGLPSVLATSMVLQSFEQNETLEFSIRVAFFLVVVLCFFSMIMKKEESEEGEAGVEGVKLENPEIKVSAPWALGAGFVTGLVIGVTSVGGGVLIIPMLMRIFKVNIRQAVGTSILASLIIALAGVAFMSGSVQWWLAFCLLTGSIPMVFLGAFVSKWIPSRFVRRLVIFLMIVAACAVFVK
jgi:uncharacterized protein